MLEESNVCDCPDNVDNAHTTQMLESQDFALFLYSIFLRNIRGVMLCNIKMMLQLRNCFPQEIFALF